MFLSRRRANGTGVRQYRIDILVSVRCETLSLGLGFRLGLIPELAKLLEKKDLPVTRCI